jgi:shikimate dehydrogenase
MRYPTVTTRLVILLGKPLGHSVSPVMHNSAFAELGMDYCYLPVEVAAEDLATVFAGLKKMNLAGGNVTVPHKIRIIDLLDRLDPLAQSIGAVNTICLEQGQAVGYNTDGYGFLRSLQEVAGISPAGERFFLLGAGGAARAIAMTLAAEGAETIIISNRTAERAEALAEEINRVIRPCATMVSAGAQEQRAALADCTVLINCTSLGMAPAGDGVALDPALLHPGLTVADIVYNPMRTRLLAAAEKIGCRTVPGLGMLIHQGAAAFTLWTGREPPLATMRRAALAQLNRATL